jgi:hypothetical protein
MVDATVLCHPASTDRCSEDAEDNEDHEACKDHTEPTIQRKCKTAADVD